MLVTVMSVLLCQQVIDSLRFSRDCFSRSIGESLIYRRSDTSCYVYALKDPRSSAALPFYIGKDTGTRSFDRLV